MANTAYPKGAERILSGAVNLVSAVIKAALVPSTYTYSASHEYLAVVGSRIGVDQTLANPTVVNGVFDADDVDFGAQAPGATIKAVVLYLDTPPSVAELKKLLQELGFASARELMRKKEDLYKELGLGEVNGDDLIRAMHQHPKLIERPIVIKNGQARIGRPPEQVLEILN